MANQLEEIRRQAADVKKSARVELTLEVVDEETKRVSTEASGIFAEVPLEGEARLELWNSAGDRIAIPSTALKSLKTVVGKLTEEV